MLLKCVIVINRFLFLFPHCLGYAEKMWFDPDAFELQLDKNDVVHWHVMLERITLLLKSSHVQSPGVLGWLLVICIIINICVASQTLMNLWA